ncbi:MAG: hypothetical protein M3Y44_15940 [Actinomycetota bacterium]|nr:hypothetical protein [Actinomycetota bacterium]
MRGAMRQAGVRVLIECRQPSVSRILQEASGTALQPAAEDDPDVHIVVTDETAPFATVGWDPLTRGAYQQDGNVVLTNACGSGFDLRVSVAPYLAHAKIVVEARYRPPARDRMAALALRSRFHLLARAVLLQYPALWVAGTCGRAPLHAAAVATGESVLMLAGPGGVGRSTLLLQALASGAQACSDNLCVSDGHVVHGLVEPVRVEGVGGRRMPHGRGECELPGRVESLRPDRLVVLRRASGGKARVRALAPERAAQVLAAGTYMAGELRRYWAFAATLALGTGRGPVHPGIGDVAHTLARLPAAEITLGDRPSPSLVELLGDLTELRS